MHRYDLPFHEYAEIFPLITGEEYEALVQDIDANGQRAPIILFEGKILDGRNRYRACKDLLLPPVTEEYAGDDALGYVLSLNLYRRQLTVAQRALIAAELSSLRGAIPDLESAEGQDKEAARLAVEEAAKVLGISPRSVSSACKVVREGTAELLQAVKTGEVSVSAAEQVAKLDKETQQDLCSRGPKAIRKAARDMRQQNKHPPKDRSAAVALEPPAEVLSEPMPAAVPIEDDDSEDDDFSSNRKPAAKLLFEMTDAGMQFGREAEGVADDIINAVEDGLDLQYLAYLVDVAKKLEGKVRSKLRERYE